jgi:flagellar biogenesis protein FliO
MADLPIPMSTIQVICRVSRLIRWFFLSLTLGSYFFLFLPPKLAALEPNSGLFQKGQGSTSGDLKSSQPLALPEETPRPLPGFLSTITRVLLALGLIVGLIYLTVWGLKVFWERKGLGNLGEEGKPIKILASTYLAPRKTLHLVEVGKRILVLGVGQEEIHCLDVITSPDEVEDLKQGSQTAFPDLFQRILRKQDSSQEENQKIMREGNQALGGYVEKLKKMSKRGEKKSDEDSGEVK